MPEIKDSKGIKKDIEKVLKKPKKVCNDFFSFTNNDDIPVEDIIPAVNIFIQFGDNCIESNWSINPCMPISDVRKISTLKTPEKIDKYFYNYYMSNNKSNLKSLNNVILNSAIEEKYKKAYEQCYFSFINEKFIVCACTLFPIIEGLIRKSDDNSQYSTVASIIKKKKQEVVVKYEISIEKLELDIILKIINKIFESARKCEFEPAYTNRNWFLHGRSEYDVNKLDCLKLINLIGTLSKLETNKKTQESSQ